MTDSDLDAMGDGPAMTMADVAAKAGAATKIAIIDVYGDGDVLKTCLDDGRDWEALVEEFRKIEHDALSDSPPGDPPQIEDFLKSKGVTIFEHEVYCL